MAMIGISCAAVAHRAGQTRQLLSAAMPAAAAAYSSRLLNASYAGPALRVRRGNDNVEQDIGFSNGDINVAALKAFIGNNTAYVKTWYDQSGNARHLTQATTTAQPRIANAGNIDGVNGRAALRFDGTAQTLLTAAFAISQPFTRCAVVTPNSVGAGGTRVLLESITDNPPSPQYIDASGNLQIYANLGPVQGRAAVSAKPTNLICVFNGAASLVAYNGSTVTLNPGPNGTNGLAVASNGNGGQFAAASFAEILLFASALTTAQRQVIESNQRAYYGLP